MKIFASFLLLCALTVSGCTHHYVMTLTNGSRVDAFSKPKLKDGAYHYKDIHGDKTLMPAGRVVEIAPESMAQDNKGKQFLPTKN